MKALGQLIRLRTHQVHERQKSLADLRAALTRVRQVRDELEARALIEAVHAESAETGTLNFPAWLRRLDAARTEIERHAHVLEDEIAAAQAALAQAYQDLKKIEIVRDRQLEDERRAEFAAEQAMLDEIALGIERR